MGQGFSVPHASQDFQRLREKARHRGGVVSSEDLRECGFSLAVVRRRVSTGDWPALSDTALAWILRLTFGAKTRISGVLALRNAGWSLPCQTHIVVLPEKPNISLPGVTVLRRPERSTPVSADGLRFLPPREALLDCLSVLPEAAAIDLFDGALQKRYVRPAAFAALMETRRGRGRRGFGQLSRLRIRAESGSRSEAEQRMARLLKRSGTGPWTSNFPVYDDDGRVAAEIDFAHEGLRLRWMPGRSTRIGSPSSATEHDRTSSSSTVGSFCVSPGSRSPNDPMRSSPRCMQPSRNGRREYWGGTPVLRVESGHPVKQFTQRTAHSQQMRGSCSASGRSTTRVPPMPVLATTIPGCSATTVPTRRAPTPSGCDCTVASAASAESALTKATKTPSLAT